MAQAQIKNHLGLIDKRKTQGSSNKTVQASTVTNLSDVTAMRARLTAISASTYTATVLDKMSVNDMVYAIRLADEAASI